MTRSRIIRIAATVLIGIALYAVAGFFVIPRLAPRFIAQFVGEATGHILQIEHMAFNPFTFEVTFENSKLDDRQGKRVLALARGYADIDVTGLMHRSIVLSEVSLEGPQLEFRYFGPADSNLSRLMSAVPGGGDTDADPLSVEIGKIIIEGGELTLIDAAKTPAIRTRFHHIRISGEQFSSSSRGTSPLSIAMNGADGAEVRIDGRFGLNPLSASGTVRLEQFELARLYPWIEDRISLEAPAGRLSLTGTVSVSADQRLRLDDAELVLAELQLQAGGAVSLQAQAIRIALAGACRLDREALELGVSELALSAEGVMIRDLEAGSQLLALREVRLSGGELDFIDRDVHVSELTFDGGKATLERDAQGRINWRRITDKLDLGGAQRTPSPPWQLSLDAMNTHDLDVNLVDQSPGQSVEQRLSGIELTMTNLGTAAQQRADFDLSMQINAGGSASAKGWLSPKPLAAEADITIAGVDLSPFDPYLHDKTTLQLRSGVVSAELTVLHGDGATTIGGQTGISELALVDSRDGQAALSMDEFVGTGLDISGPPFKASIKTVSVNGGYLKLEIYPDHSVNLADWFRAPQEPGAEPGDAQAGKRPATPVVIERIEIGDGRLDFSDQSLAPQFQMRAEHLRGTIVGLNLAGQQPASLELDGKIGEFGSAKITGQLRPFHPSRYSQVNMQIRNIDTSVMSPYAARFAGRKIDSGKLNLDLGYRIEDGKLDGNHDIELENFVLGERVESPDALDLPLDLAIALLKDSQGRIDIAVPVSGRLDDPKFDLRAVVAKAVGKLITSVATAPFKVLGALLGSPEKALNEIPFEPGRAAITPPALELLTSLSEALKERPALALRAVGAYDPDADRSALAREQVRLHVTLAADVSPSDRMRPGPINFSDPKIQEVLDEFATARLGAEKLASIPTAPSEPAPDAAEAGNDGASETRYRAIFEALVNEEPIEDGALETLARYRAQAIVDQLQSLGIEGARVKTADGVETVKADRQRVAVELKAWTPRE